MLQHLTVEVSDCCESQVEVYVAPDFLGDIPEKMKIATCWYRCVKCGQPCNVFLKVINKSKGAFMKILFLVLALVLAMAVPAFGASVVLPRIIAPHTLAWDDPNLPAANVTSYRVYYRTVATPANPWDDTKMATVAAPTKTLDLSGVITANGNYECAVSALNASAESGLSNTVNFLLDIPTNPSNLRKQ